MLTSDNEVSTTVAEIFDPTQIIIKVDVPLNEFSKVKMGEKPEFDLNQLIQFLTAILTLSKAKLIIKKTPLKFM